MRRSKGLTSFHQALLDFIDSFIEKNGTPPTQSEVAVALGVSRSKVQRALDLLEAAGYLERDRKIARGIRLTAPSQMDGMFRIPMAGIIQAGEPIPIPASEFSTFTQEDAIEIPVSEFDSLASSNSINISASLAPKGKNENIFALKVEGDMTDAMIIDGDIVVLQPVEKARNGEMVAVWLPDRNETTLKFFFNGKDHYRLQPVNPTIKPTFVSKSEPLEIKGKVVLVIRKYKWPLDKDSEEALAEKNQAIHWRLDAAVPNQVQVNKTFDLGVLICPDTFPLLNDEDLTKVKSASIHPVFDDKQPYMQLRVEVQAPDCKIHGENPRLLRVSKDKHSPIYFQLTPSSIGVISVLVSAFQELDMLGNTRVRTVALKEVGNVKIEVSSMALGANPAYENEVFVSYAWGGESERVVDELEKAFTDRGLLIVRDKKDLDYKGSIKEFEQRIGRGQCVVLVISNKYLESENCMYELVEIDENKEFRKRVFPIVLADANIYKSKSRIAYIRYWDKRIKELNKELKAVDRLTHLDGFTDELNQFDRIRSKFDHLSKLLSDMNALTPEIHAASGFSILINQVEAALNKEPIL